MATEQSGKRVKGEVVPFGKLMAALTTMKRRERLAPYEVDVYEAATAAIPLPVLSRAVTRLITTAEWFPTVHELLEACEAIRVEMRGSLKFEPCGEASCSAQGWTERVVGGVHRMVRCDCWQSHQERVKALGVPDVPLALPAARVSTWEHVSDE